MDKNNHSVTIPMEDYAELMKAYKNQIPKEDLNALYEKASWLQINHIGPGMKSELHISSRVPSWFHLGELHVYQDKTNRVLKKYRLVEIEDNRLDYSMEQCKQVERVIEDRIKSARRAY